MEVLLGQGFWLLRLSTWRSDGLRMLCRVHEMVLNLVDFASCMQRYPNFMDRKDLTVARLWLSIYSVIPTFDIGKRKACQRRMEQGA
jgi:hypothetical protein